MDIIFYIITIAKEKTFSCLNKKENMQPCRPLQNLLR